MTAVCVIGDADAVCVCFQAQIDHYLALVNNQVKDVVGK